MFDKRLMQVCPESKKYIVGNIILQWLELCLNAVMIFVIAQAVGKLYEGSWKMADLLFPVILIAVTILLRFFTTRFAVRMSYKASKTVKKVMREKIYAKLLRLGTSYREHVTTAEIVQESVEGVEQLESYFGQYVPQFFYAFLAPLTLFFLFGFSGSWLVAVILLICVPLIPGAIMMVQKIAKKLLSKYWGKYTALGSTFLENLQGMTALKTYQADQFKNEQMNEESEEFRVVTMKVLTMQLNSITIMDFIAYGGAGLGILLAVLAFIKGNLTLSSCIFMILLSADFFLPMRRLGSYFHVAMNGMAASDKIFAFLNETEPAQKTASFPEDGGDIRLENVSFSYDGEKEVLHNVSLCMEKGKFTGIVGESGSGKSTIAALLTGRNTLTGKLQAEVVAGIGKNGAKSDRSRQTAMPEDVEQKHTGNTGQNMPPATEAMEGELNRVKNTGDIRIGTTDHSAIAEDSLLQNITYIGHNSVFFKGTVRQNLISANPQADDDELWSVLKQCNLDLFLKEQNGLDTQLLENASNLSGGQKQRLALARAILHDSPVFIFDEATSNIDIESEDAILSQIRSLAKEKTILMISHRLANVTACDRIYCMEHGRVAEQGTHEQLLQQRGSYYALWQLQQELENFGKGAFDA